jgi:rare lipoprotein A
MKRFLPSVRWLAAAVIVALLPACAETQFIAHTAKRVGKIQKNPPPAGVYKIGSPYQIRGTWYYPAENFKYEETGIASWYGPGFHGRSTANGEIFDMNGLTAAHRTLPMPSIVRVTNLENGRSIVLKVNDRGPFARGRIIDVSRRAAQLLGFVMNGTARVRVRILANDSRRLATRTKGRTELATTGTPIIVDRLPKPTVKTESLPPPPGATMASVSVSAGEAGKAGGGAGEANNVHVLTSTPTVLPNGDNPKLTEAVSVEPIRDTRLFVQAGAFTQFTNANRVRARLSGLGQVKVLSVLVDGRDLFRVRIGPLSDIEGADEALEAVLQVGYTDARIVVD